MVGKSDVKKIADYFSVVSSELNAEGVNPPHHAEKRNLRRYGEAAGVGTLQAELLVLFRSQVGVN